MNETSRHVTTSDAELYVRSLGAGPDLVFIHGWPLHGETYAEVARRLADRFRCHLVDLAGAGKSRWTRATDLSAPAHAARIRAVVAGLGIERYALIGFDSGGYFARLVADGNPQVAALILSNTEVAGHRAPFINFYKAAIGAPGARHIFGTMLRSRRYLRSKLGFGGCYADLSRIDDAFVAAYVAPARTAQGFDGIRRTLQAFDWKLVDALPELHARLTMPVSLIWGDADPTFPIATLDTLKRELPNLRDVTILAGGKLLVHDEQPDAYAAAVRAAATAAFAANGAAATPSHPAPRQPR